jgi:RNA polymerase-binding transcription factor DksA
MDGSITSHDIDSRDWLLARVETLRNRVTRVRRNQSRSIDPAPRDVTDAAILRENDGILQAIEDSACRELAQVEHALARLARPRGGN